MSYGESIALKSRHELDQMREVGQHTGEILLTLRDKAQAGVTTGELNELAEGELKRRGLNSPFLNYSPERPFMGRRPVECLPELLFQKAIHSLDLLLLAKLNPVVRKTDPALPMHSGRIRPSLNGALFAEAAIALEKELGALTPTKSTDRTSITCHLLPLRLGAAWRAASIMRNWSNVSDHRNFMPAAWSARSADSRPPPGPLTSTPRVRTPCSWAFLAHSSAAICAA